MLPSTEFVPCNLCGSQTATVRYTDVKRIDTQLTEVVECDGCGMVYLNPRLARLVDNFTMNEAYLREHYLPYYQKIGILTPTLELDAAANDQFHQSALAEMQPYRELNRVLDVGCAIGLFLKAARADGWDCYGVEPSHALAEYGRLHLGLSITEGELGQAGFAQNSFDVITLWGVTEHLLDPKATYRLVYSLLRPGGLLLLRMPNWQSLARELLGPEWDMFVTDHFYYFTPDTLTLLMKQTGFIPKKVGADGLVPSELDAIVEKLGPDAAAEAVARLQGDTGNGRGSTLLAAAQKPRSRRDRMKMAGQLLRRGELSDLTAEARTYLRWFLADRRG